MAGSDSLYDTIPSEEMMYSSKIAATIMSTPPNKNIIAQSPIGSGKSTAQSRIGSGKSTALLKAMLQRVDRKLKYPQAIYVVPNRESAIKPGFKDSVVRIMQKFPQCQVIMCFTISSDAVEAFVSKIKQVLSEKEFVSFTGEMEVPSLDSVKQYKVNVRDDTSKVMFINNKLLDLIVEAGQTIVFVHTIDHARMFERLQGNRFMYKTLDGADTQKQRDKILEVNVPDEPSNVMVIINKLLDRIAEAGQTIVFVDTIDGARMLVERLEGNRFMCKTLDGADTQEQRDKILEELKEKRFQVLISTKILDWVFDRSQVGLMVFYDLSIISGSSQEADLEQYSHCIGRAGHFGRKGAVFNLMCGDKDKKIMENIETLNNVTEVLWNNDVQFKDALIEAGLR